MAAVHVVTTEHTKIVTIITDQCHWSVLTSDDQEGALFPSGQPDVDRFVVVTRRTGSSINVTQIGLVTLSTGYV